MPLITGSTDGIEILPYLPVFCSYGNGTVQRYGNGNGTEKSEFFFLKSADLYHQTDKIGIFGHCRGLQHLVCSMKSTQVSLPDIFKSYRNAYRTVTVTLPYFCTVPLPKLPF